MKRFDSNKPTEKARDAGQIVWLLVVVIAWVMTGALTLPNLQ